MQKRIITVSREFGSGGRTIAKQAAEKLGYAYYDKELIEKVAEDTGLSKEYIAEDGEFAPSKSRFAYSFAGRGQNGMSTEDYLWVAQSNMIRSLAEKGSCVIVGRCADYILRDRDDCLNVFIHADMEKRAGRIVTLYGETKDSPEKRLKDKDKKRRVNYKYYTGQEWGMSQNYHITLDSSAVGLEKCAEIIVGIALDQDQIF